MKRSNPMYLEQISPRREFHNAGMGFRECSANILEPDALNYANSEADQPGLANT